MPDRAVEAGPGPFSATSDAGRRSPEAAAAMYRRRYNEFMASPLEQLTAGLARLSTHYDITGQWPERSLEHLNGIGAWTWIIPKAYGGTGLDAEPQLRAYEAVAEGCLSTLLILSQRDGACELIAQSENEALKEELLPRLARNEIMISVGISQLTTSHQTGKPALVAVPDGEDYLLKGFMPWVTAAEKCDFVVSGAVLPDGRQILAAVPVDLPGVQVDPAMNLMALESSRTSEVHCREVRLASRYLLAGPTEKALSRRSAVKVLVVAASGIGLARTMVQLVADHASKAQGPMVEQAEELAARFEAVRERFYKFAGKLNEPEADIPSTEIRVSVNDLLMRLAVATLVFSKGSGFIRQRDAQRLVREAMFFLVWSAPENVRVQTLASFLATPEPESKSMQR